MSEKTQSRWDAFTFSLGGMAAKSSFVIVPAIADDRIDKIRDGRQDRPRDADNRGPRGCFRRRHREAHC